MISLFSFSSLLELLRGLLGGFCALRSLGRPGRPKKSSGLWQVARPRTRWRIIAPSPNRRSSARTTSPLSFYHNTLLARGRTRRASKIERPNQRVSLCVVSRIDRLACREGLYRVGPSKERSVRAHNSTSVPRPLSPLEEDPVVFHHRALATCKRLRAERDRGLRRRAQCRLVQRLEGGI